MATERTDRSLLVVHAHPDDESIFTGATIARYAAEGARVTLLTCTMGERGWSPAASPDTISQNGLAELRCQELRAACAALGVTDHRFLGGPGRWLDSGPGGPGGPDPRSFCLADTEDAADEVVAVIKNVQPQVIVTYGADGFYGHPDHVKAHQVAWHAYQRACTPSRTKFYAVTIPASDLAGPPRRPPGPPGTAGRGAVRGKRIGAVADEITTEINASGYLQAKLAALRSHATQVTVSDPFVRVPVLGEIPALGTEYYTLLAGPGSASSGEQDRVHENDLFAGLGGSL